MDFIPVIIAAVAGAVVSAGGIFALNKSRENGGKNKADDLVRRAKNEASEIVLKAKNEAAETLDKAQREETQRRKELKKTEDRLIERETLLDKKLDQLDKKSDNLRKQEDELEDIKNEVREIRTKAQEKLEKIAGLSKTEARDKLIQMVERETKHDLAELVIKEQKALSDQADETAESILLTAMERMSSEVTADRTVTSLKLPDDDMKGRIIGKEGRNIQALQHATGVDVLIDDTPGMVVLILCPLNNHMPAAMVKGKYIHIITVIKKHSESIACCHAQIQDLIFIHILQTGMFGIGESVLPRLLNPLETFVGTRRP